MIGRDHELAFVIWKHELGLKKALTLMEEIKRKGL